MAHKALIGISTDQVRDSATGAQFLRVRPAYVEGVIQAGGAPVLLPVSSDLDALRGAYDALDGLLLTGGGDINPVQYGAAASPLTNGVVDARDNSELHLARWAHGEDKPLFCICRGVQIFNVALGGTLIQDIRSEAPGALWHDRFADSWFYEIAHEVSIEAGSRLREALGVGRVEVNSLHHQAVAQVAPGLCIAARADDGVIEALEDPSKRFAIGVQWHPETLWPTRPEMARLFSAFVAAASKA